MDSGKTMGAQLMDVMSWAGFALHVARYGGHAKVHLRQAVPGHALRAVDLVRDPAGHRGMPGSESLSPVCHGLLPTCVAFDLGRRQREPRLAHVGRSRGGPHSVGTQVLLRQEFWALSRPHCPCARFHDHRRVPLAVRLGLVPDNQGRRQDSHAAGSQGFHPCLYLHQRQKDVRCLDSGSESHRGWCILCDGPWPTRLPSDVRHQPARRVLCHPGQARGARPLRLIDVDRSGAGCHQRSAGGPQLVLCVPAISRTHPPYPLRGCQDRKNECVAHGQHRTAGPNDHLALPVATDPVGLHFQENRATVGLCEGGRLDSGRLLF